MTASVLGQRGLRGRVAPEHTSFARNLNDLEGKKSSRRRERGRVVAATHGQLTRSAHQRLFPLKEAGSRKV